MLEDPLEMADPRKAFTENPYEQAKVELTYARVSDPIGGEPDETHEREGEEFAKGHYEQLNAATGTIAVGDQEWAVSGYGLRDHSWGPRTWQAPWYYRWLTVNFGDDFGFMGSRIARQDGDGMRGGFVWDGERILTWPRRRDQHRLDRGRGPTTGAIEATLHQTPTASSAESSRARCST